MRDIGVVSELGKAITSIIKKDDQRELLARESIDENHLESIEEDLIFTFVKKAIDSFDPYFVLPDSPYEYDGESERIAEKISIKMSIDEIAELMKEEFNFSFSAEFTNENFYTSAETVYNLLEDWINNPDIKNKKREDVELI